MIQPEYYRVPVKVGSRDFNIYFYRTETNLFDLQYHWCYTRGMHSSLPEAIADFSKEFESYHKLQARNLSFAVGEPVKVAWAEVQAARPRTQEATIRI